MSGVTSCISLCSDFEYIFGVIKRCLLFGVTFCNCLYDRVSKSFRNGRLERELQM